jgi:hypothetical protein
MRTTQPQTIRYHACALNPAGGIGILLVERVISAPGVLVSKSQTWTGETFPDTRKGQNAANALMLARNCGSAS